MNVLGCGKLLTWLFRKFWEPAPRHHETIWSSFNEEDGIEVIRYQLLFIGTQLERIADLFEEVNKE